MAENFSRITDLKYMHEVHGGNRSYRENCSKAFGTTCITVGDQRATFTTAWAQRTQTLSVSQQERQQGAHNCGLASTHNHLANNGAPTRGIFAGSHELLHQLHLSFAEDNAVLRNRMRTHHAAKRMTYRKFKHEESRVKPSIRLYEVPFRSEDASQRVRLDRHGLLDSGEEAA